MEKQFNTMEFYRDKVARSIFFISAGAILAAILVSLVCICVCGFGEFGRQ